VIAQDPTHRYRAIGTLTGFTAAFVICSLAIMGGQDHRAVGTEWLVVAAAVAGAVYVYGYVQAIRVGESSVGLRMTRLVGGTGCYVAEIVGAALLIAGQIAGLYVAAAAMIVLLAFMISGGRRLRRRRATVNVVVLRATAHEWPRTPGPGGRSRFPWRR
jgi:hypothetical protein